MSVFIYTLHMMSTQEVQKDVRLYVKGSFLFVLPLWQSQAALGPVFGVMLGKGCPINDSLCVTLSSQSRLGS